ncbi:MAG: WD40 repeat domain-containing protein [Kofleriaceae bacterium]
MRARPSTTIRGAALAGLALALGCGGTPAPRVVSPTPGPAPTPTTRPAPAPLASSDRLGDALPRGATARLGTTRWRTGYAIYGVAFSDDGTQVLAASEGLQVFARDSGRRLATHDVEEPWREHKVEDEHSGNPRFNTRRLSPSATAVTTLGRGRIVVMGAGRIEVLDLGRRVTLALTEASGEGGDPIATSADGTLIAFRRDRRTAVVWSPGAGTITELGNHLSLTAITLSDDGRIAYTADGAMVGRWDLHAGKVTYTRVRDSVYDLDYVGGVLVAGSGDRVLSLDPTSLSEVGGCHVGETVWAIDLDASGLVAVASESVAAVCDPVSGRLNPLGNRRSMPHQVRWSPDGGQIAVADEDVVELYDTRRGADGALALGGHDAELTAVAATPSGVVITADDVGGWPRRQADGAPLATLRRADGARIQALAVRDDRVVIAERDGAVGGARRRRRRDDDGVAGAAGRAVPRGRRVQPRRSPARGRGQPAAHRRRGHRHPARRERARRRHRRAGASGRDHRARARAVVAGRAVGAPRRRRPGRARRGCGAERAGAGAAHHRRRRRRRRHRVRVRQRWQLPLARRSRRRALGGPGPAVPRQQRGAVARRRLWAAASYGGEISLGMVGDARPVATLRHGDRAVRVAWSPDGTSLLSAADDTTALVWAMDLLGVGVPR